MASRVKSAILLGVAVGAVGVSVSLTEFASRLEENAGLDWLFALRGPRQAPGNVIVVSIDRQSAEALGVAAGPAQWPRSLHARLVRMLSAAGVRVIAFDIFFAGEGPAADDADLAAAMRQAGNVILVGRLEKNVLEGQAISVKLQLPAQVLADSALAVAPFPLPVVPVRVSQFWAFLDGFGDLPTLPAVAYGAYERQALDRLRASYFFNYYGPSRSIATIPYYRLVNGMSARTDDDRAVELRDSIVFVGFAAKTQTEQTDSFYSVFSEDTGLNLSGVEIAATATANLLEGRPLRPVTPITGLVIILVWGGLLGIVCRMLPGALGIAVGVLGGLLYLAGAEYAFATADLWAPVMVPIVLQAPLAVLGALLLQFRQVRDQRERIRAAMGRYVPPQVVDRLVAEGAASATVAEVVHGTCMATDASQYTLMAETLAPDELGRLMNAYYEILFAEVERHGGQVSDVVGDAMMAIWASSRPAAGIEAQACQAALQLKVTLALRAAAGERAALPTRIGIHSGQIRLGNVGARQHLEYRAVGDIVNTASRIEGLNKWLGTRVLVSAETLRGTEGFVAREVGTFLLAGKSVPVVIHELMGSSDSGEPRLRLFADALGEFREQRWVEAGLLFGHCLELDAADGVATFYVRLCEEYLLSGPSSFSAGVVRIAGK